MGGERAVRILRPPRRPLFPLAGKRPEGPAKPRAFEEWKALLRWGKLPEEEAKVAGFHLRLAREEAGLTQAQLALRLGITQQAVARTERWSSNPTWALLRSWARACGCDLVLELVRREPGQTQR
jgi:DNA-binding XRE family transcriptional regulator